MCSPSFHHAVRRARDTKHRTQISMSANRRKKRVHYCCPRGCCGAWFPLSGERQKRRGTSGCTGKRRKLSAHASHRQDSKNSDFHSKETLPETPAPPCPQCALGRCSRAAVPTAPLSRR